MDDNLNIAGIEIDIADSGFCSQHDPMTLLIVVSILPPSLSLRFPLIEPCLFIVGGEIIRRCQLIEHACLYKPACQYE